MCHRRRAGCWARTRRRDTPRAGRPGAHHARRPPQHGRRARRRTTRTGSRRRGARRAARATPRPSPVTATSGRAIHSGATADAPGKAEVTIHEPPCAVPRSRTRGTTVWCAAHFSRSASTVRSGASPAGDHFTNTRSSPAPTSNVRPPSSFSRTTARRPTGGDRHDHVGNHDLGRRLADTVFGVRHRDERGGRGTTGCVGLAARACARHSASPRQSRLRPIFEPCGGAPLDAPDHDARRSPAMGRAVGGRVEPPRRRRGAHALRRRRRVLLAGGGDRHGRPVGHGAGQSGTARVLDDGAAQPRRSPLRARRRAPRRRLHLDPVPQPGGPSRHRDGRVRCRRPGRCGAGASTTPADPAQVHRMGTCG